MSARGWIAVSHDGSRQPITGATKRDVLDAIGASSARRTADGYVVDACESACGWTIGRVGLTRVRALTLEYGKLVRKHGEFSSVARATRRVLESELKKLNQEKRS